MLFVTLGKPKAASKQRIARRVDWKYPGLSGTRGVLGL